MGPERYPRRTRLFARIVGGGNSFTYPALPDLEDVQELRKFVGGCLLSHPLFSFETGTRRVSLKDCCTIVHVLLKADIYGAPNIWLIAHHIFQHRDYPFLTLQSPCEPSHTLDIRHETVLTCKSTFAVVTNIAGTARFSIATCCVLTSACHAERTRSRSKFSRSLRYALCIICGYLDKFRQ